MVKEFYESQDRTQTVQIKPGLVNHLREIAKTIFPCAKVGPEDALELLISTYLEIHNIPETRVASVSYPPAQIIQHAPIKEESVHQVILNTSEPTDDDWVASEINFAADQ